MWSTAGLTCAPCCGRQGGHGAGRHQYGEPGPRTAGRRQHPLRGHALRRQRREFHRRERGRWFIPTNSAHPDEAWTFLRYMMRTENQIEHAKYGSVPMLKSGGSHLHPRAIC